MLYPLKFTPIFKERIWGGKKLATALGKDLGTDRPIGESWELSGVEGDVSVVSNGKLAGNTLSDLIEVYMGDLVGDKVYETYGLEFPVLIKIIDAADVLSIQVHPDDELAAERHKSYGKTEMWYIIDNDPDAELYVGFNQPVDKAKYLKSLEDGKLDEILSKYKVSPGKAYFIPAGAIHAIGRGNLIAEIQQTSDITYRVFDWNRTDDAGNPRQLHTELAVDCINYSPKSDYEVSKAPIANTPVQLASCKYFETNALEVDGAVDRDYAALDSFVIYMCLSGSATIDYGEGKETMSKGDTVLVPAEIQSLTLSGKANLLEVYIP